MNVDPSLAPRLRALPYAGAQPFATSACLGSARVPVTRGRVGRGG